MTRISRLLPIALVLGCSPAVPEEGPPPLAITGVDVIPMSGPSILPSQTVVVREGRIAALGPASTTPIPAAAVRIDGAGKFLIPGLADMHVHVDHESELDLYPAYGVTTVVNLRGLPRHLEWRDRIAREHLGRPTLLTAGDYMDGYPPFMQPMMSFDDAEAAAAAVVRQKEAGYDFVKVYTRLDAGQFGAIGRAAREAGIPVVGHGSGNYPLEELIRWQANISHSDDLIRWYWDPDRPEESLEGIVRTLEPSSTTVTANLNFSRSLIRQHQDLDSVLAQPEARFLHPAVFQPFRRENNRYARRDGAWLGRVREQFALKRKLIGKLSEAGVVVLAGTDASTAGVYPGFSLHEELEELVAAGLTPLQALAAATRDPGRFVQRHLPEGGPPFGQIVEGYRADLVLLERNPLERIEHASSVAGVVMRGEWHSGAELRQRLERLSESFRELDPAVRQLERLIADGRIEEARTLFDETRRRQPGAILFSQYVPFFIGYGFLYGQEGYHPDPRRREVALGLYRMYAQTYPEFHSAHYLLAKAHQANGNGDEALAAVRRALRIHPAYPDARKLLEELTRNVDAGG